jgi:hypothetical protein
VKEIINWYDNLIFREYALSLHALALFRILFAALGLFLIGYPSVTWLSEVPDYFYRPQLLNIAYLISGEIPDYWVLFLLSFFPSLLLTAILFGFQTKTSSILFSVTVIISAAFTGSLGKIDHGVIYPLTAFIMAFSEWGKVYSLDYTLKEPKAGSQHSGLPVFLVALTVGFGMFTAGFFKVQGAWLDPGRVGVLHHYFTSYEMWGRRELLAPLFYEVENYYFWKALDYLTIGFEILFFPAILNKRIFQFFIVAALCFHTAIFLMLNITISSIFLAYALFLPWRKLVFYLRRNVGIKRHLNRLLHRNAFFIALLLVALACGTFLVFHSGETIVAIGQIIFWSSEWEYRMVVCFILYTLAWGLLIWHLSSQDVSIQLKKIKQPQ